MTSQYYVIIVTYLLTSHFVEGCVKYTAPTVDDAGNTEYKYLRTNMKTCMSAEKSWSEAIADYFVLHSTWFETTESTTCKADATADCWMTSFADLFYYEPNFMTKVVECATKYEKEATGSKLQKRNLKLAIDGIRSRRTVTDAPNPVLCPPYPDVDFVGDVTPSITPLKNEDTTVTKFTELLAVSHLISIKPKYATCDAVFGNAKLTNDEKVTGCETCNYLMISALLKSTSTITPTIAKAAVKKSQSTFGICTPDLKLRLDDVMLTKMGVTSPADDVMLGAHKYCTNDVISTNVKVNEECKPTIVTSSLTKNPQIIFQVSLDKCDIKATLVNDEYVYEAIVTFIPKLETDAVIGRFKCSTFKFQCVIPRKLKVIFGNRLHPQIKATVGDEMAGESNYRLSFDVTHNGQVIAANQIEVGENLDAKLKLVNVLTPANYKLRAGDCWASKTSDSSAKTDIYKIVDCVGCKEKNSFDTKGDEIVITQNDASEVKFTFRSFMWTDAPNAKIYVFCKINVCHSLAQTCPTAADCQKKAVCPVVTAGGRRMRRSTDDVTTMMSFGPIHVINRTVSGHHDVNPCSVDNGGCEEICGGKSSEVICSCFDGGMLMFDGKSCSNAQHRRVEMTIYMATTPWTNLLIICVFIISISVVIYKFATNF